LLKKRGGEFQRLNTAYNTNILCV